MNKLIIFILIVGSTINLKAAVLECLANDGVQDIPELTLKVSEPLPGEPWAPPIIDVEYKGLFFNFAILYDMFGSVPYAVISVKGKNFQVSFSGENKVSAAIDADEVKNVSIDCSLHSSNYL